MTRGWTFDEERHAGAEHLDPDEAARFDEKLPFDPTPEVDLLLEHGLSEPDTIVDFGAGTGVFPLAVAPHCERVVAVDVSPAMLTRAQRRIEQRGVQNIETVTAGFLSYDHEGSAASFVFSKDALHHLPDFWKGEALKSVGELLIDGGIFRLRDFVFSFDFWDSLDEIETWIDENKHSTSFTEEEIHRHFREEYSTYGFVLESLLERVGFEILDADYTGGFYAAYVCQWRGPHA